DDAERERRRHEMGELYRTLLGHFRHEIGHYYWDRLIRRTYPRSVEAGLKRPPRVLGMPRPKPGRSRPPAAIVLATFTRPGPRNHASEPGVVFGVCSLNNAGTALCGVA